MQTELIFLQTIPQNPGSGYKSDNPDSLAQDDPCRTGSMRAKGSGEPNNFQSTLKKLSHAHNRSDPSQNTDGSPSSGLKNCDTLSNPKPNLDGDAGLREKMAAENSAIQDNSNDGEVKIPSTEELVAFWKLFSPLSVSEGTAGIKTLPHFGLDMPWLSDGMSGAGDKISALRQLTLGFQQQGITPSIESINEFIRFQRHFAQMTAGNDSLPTDAKLGEVQSLSQMPESAESGQNDVSVVRTLNELGSQKDLTTNELSKNTAIESSGKMTNILQEGHESSGKMTNILQEGHESSGKITNILQEGQSEKTDVAKLAPETSFIRSQSSELQADVETEAKTGSFQKAEAAAEKSRGVNLGKAAENRDGFENKMILNNQLEKESASQKLNSDARAGLENSTQRLSGGEPLSKVINESQAHQDTDIKLDKAFSDEPGVKVMKVDTPNNENGSLNSHNQSSNRVWETSSSSKTIESDQRDLSAQTIDQIVRKASIQLRNGHNEASIELKPEYLGHIRMQISTENHQVTVRILAELPFVKEMIENNLHQLKTDLQQQGLDVDKLEVSVSDYSEGHEHAHKNAHQLNPQDKKEDGQNTDTEPEDAGRDSNNSAVTKNSTATVDYFA